MVIDIVIRDIYLIENPTFQYSSTVRFLLINTDKGSLQTKGTFQSSGIIENLNFLEDCISLGYMHVDKHALEDTLDISSYSSMYPHLNITKIDNIEATKTMLELVF